MACGIVLHVCIVNVNKGHLVGLGLLGFFTTGSYRFGSRAAFGRKLWRRSRVPGHERPDSQWDDRLPTKGLSSGIILYYVSVGHVTAIAVA